MVLYLFFFFFQAEDGIRDLTVTGVQTCAVPAVTPRVTGSHAGFQAEKAAAGSRNEVTDAVSRVVRPNQRPNTTSRPITTRLPASSRGNGWMRSGPSRSALIRTAVASTHFCGTILRTTAITTMMA